LVLLVVVWLGFSRLHGHRIAALAGVIALAITSTALVARHAYTYNLETSPTRKMIVAACEAIRREIPAGAEPHLWIDPAVVVRAGDAAQGFHHAICWLRFGLPGVAVDIARGEQIAEVGDLILSASGASDLRLVWQQGPLAVYKIEPPRRGSNQAGEPRAAPQQTQDSPSGGGQTR